MEPPDKRDIDIQVTSSEEQGQDLDYVSVMVYFATLMVTHLTNARSHFRMTCEESSESGSYRLRVEIDNGREVFEVTGGDEKECAHNLLTRVVERYGLYCGHPDEPHPPGSGGLH